jgi:hypothetical protein
MLYRKFANHKTHALPTDELKIYVIAHTMKDGKSNILLGNLKGRN